jgi:hypothetical protein
MGTSSGNEELLGEVQLEGINPFLLQTGSRASDYEEVKRFQECSAIEAQK